MSLHICARGMQIVPIKVLNAVQRMNHEIAS